MYGEGLLSGTMEDRMAEVEEWSRMEDGLGQRILDEVQSLSRNADSKLTALQEQVDQRFEQLDQRFEQVDQRFEQVDRRLSEMDQRFDKMDQRFEKMDQRFEKMEERFAKMDQRFIEMDMRFTRFDGKFDILIDLLRPKVIGS